MDAAPILARVAVRLKVYEYYYIKLFNDKHEIQDIIFTYLTVITSPNPNSMPFICAMKIAATASYSAVPSMLTVAPTATTNRVTLVSIPLFSSKHLKVIGRVAELLRKTYHT